MPRQLFFVCAVADIIHKPEDPARVKECFSEEINIDIVLDERMFQLHFPAAPSIRIPAGEAEGFTPLRPFRAYYHMRP